MGNISKAHVTRDIMRRRIGRIQHKNRMKGTPTLKYSNGQYEPPLARQTAVATSKYDPVEEDKKHRS